MTARRRFPTKPLNDEFQLLRSNALQRKRFRQEQFKGHEEDGGDDDDRVLLLRDEEEEPRMSSLGLPPQFAVRGEAVALQLAALESDVTRVDALHRAHLAKPTFDDSSREKEEISRLTKEIGQSVGRCHLQVKDVQRTAAAAAVKGLEAEVARNLVLALSNRLQSISETFQKSQNGFLKQLEAREAKSRLYFDDLEEVVVNDDMTAFPMNQKINTQELLLMDENTKYVEQREREINEIVRSICDLNSVFKELAHMVSEQGTVVDRIDYNVLTSQEKVEDGLKQLKLAEKHQGKNRKMRFIVILAVILVVLLFILIIKIS